MTTENLDEQLKKAMEKVKRNPKAYKSIDKDLEEECGPGPHFGPRNDIEKRRLIKEIRESGNDDE